MVQLQYIDMTNEIIINRQIQQGNGPKHPFIDEKLSQLFIYIQMYVLLNYEGFKNVSITFSISST